MSRIARSRIIVLILCLAGVFLFLLRYLDTQDLVIEKYGGAWVTTEDIPHNLRQWLRKAKAGKMKGSLDVRMFHKKTNLYRRKYDHRIKYKADDEGRYKGGVTIGHFVGNTPQPGSLMWQWRGGEMFPGFLYGKVDNDGLFTGLDITYIYPDLETGLRGHFVNGELVEAIAVEIVAHRMSNGVKELKFKEAEPYHVTWTRDVSNDTYIGAHPKIMEPHERKSVYVGRSKGGKDDGVFARRSFKQGDLVSYFNGIKTTEDKMFNDNMTDEESADMAKYYFGLGANVPKLYNIPKEIELDIPHPYRSVEEYTTTLGHKVNHMFDINTNTEFDSVDHPVFGVIVCHIAVKDIEVDEELFVNYNYGLEDAAKWYRDLYDQTYD